MAKIKVTIYDDFGNEIGQKEKKLDKGIDNLDLIEDQVEELRQEMLPEITKILLQSSQDAFKKK
jgi:hypothetical protein